MSNQKTESMECRLTSKYGVTLPVALRASLGLAPMDKVVFEKREDGILLKRARPCCKICGSEQELHKLKGFFICDKCMEIIKEA